MHSRPRKQLVDHLTSLPPTALAKLSAFGSLSNSWPASPFALLQARTSLQQRCCTASAKLQSPQQHCRHTAWITVTIKQLPTLPSGPTAVSRELGTQLPPLHSSIGFSKVGPSIFHHLAVQPDILLILSGLFPQFAPSYRFS